MHEYGGGAGGVFITTDWRKWMAVGSGVIDDARDLRNRLDNGDAHEIGVERYAVRVMETVRPCSLSLPDETRILWRKEPGDTLRVNSIEVGPENDLATELALEEDLDETLCDALDFNAFTLAFIGVTLPHLLGGAMSIDLAAAMEKALVNNPEIARHLPAAYVTPRLKAMKHRHRLGDPRFYNTPETFWTVYLEDPVPPCIIPWNYARGKFGDDVTNHLENRFMTAHPHYMWALPEARRSEKRVNQWINAAQKLRAERDKHNAFLDTHTSFADQVDRYKAHARIGELDAQLVHPVYGNNYVPRVFTASQFARVITTTGRMPVVDRADIKPEWWTAKLLAVVIAQVPDLKLVPRALLTTNMVCAFVKANAYTYGRIPGRYLTPEVERYAVMESGHPDLFKEIKKENRTLEVTRAFVANAHLYSYSFENDIEAIGPEHLMDPEVMKSLCTRADRDCKRRLYTVYPESAYDQLDELLLAERDGLSSIPHERITDAMSRRAPIGSWWQMTGTVQEERREEYKKEEQRIAHMNQSRWYNDCYDYQNDEPRSAELAMIAERGGGATQ